VESVAGKERTQEIARMLGGATPSAEATAHADEMLRRAASPVN
jgi:DNA repair ATPase RecN